MAAKRGDIDLEVLCLFEYLGEGEPNTKTWTAVDPLTKTIYAVKRVKLSNRDDMESMIKYVEQLKGVNSPHVVKCEGYVWLEQKHELWVVLEYCEGGELLELLSITGKTNLSEPQVAVACLAMSKALTDLHSRNMNFLRLMGGGLMVTAQGEVKLDFSLKHPFCSDKRRRKPTRQLPWIAPEVIDGQLTHLISDVWSLGSTAIELVEGSPPHSNLPLLQVLFLRKIPTLTEPQKWSTLFNDFLSYCFVIDPYNRPPAIELIKHPFLLEAKQNLTTATLAFRELLDQAREEIERCGGRRKALAAKWHSMSNNVSTSDDDVDERWNVPIEDDCDEPEPTKSLMLLCCTVVCQTIRLRDLKHGLPIELYEMCEGYALRDS
eukprot:TRINITY_DN3628_c0_g1_i3.p1 TRINITY_DN3628_c0_g1~~TRINITY_DN3628_c0_g1_i3.p1  ORF type:complete len:377 (+),score=56.54 TRINITY_DN3628_c0_g1_i3:97-1227(+)